MKTLYINNNSNIVVDIETDSCDRLTGERVGIQNIYLAKEPMRVIYESGEYKKTADVVKDDLIITFYDSDFKHRMIVVKSEDWVENLEKYNEHMQELKEKWAANESCKNGCCDCGEQAQA